MKAEGIPAFGFFIFSKKNTLSSLKNTANQLSFYRHHIYLRLFNLNKP